MEALRWLQAWPELKPNQIMSPLQRRGSHTSVTIAAVADLIIKRRCWAKGSLLRSMYGQRATRSYCLLEGRQQHVELYGYCRFSSSGYKAGEHPLVRCECSTAWCAIENFLQAVKPLQQAKLHGFYAHCLFICCILNTADSHCSPIVAATGCKEATTFKKQFEGTATGWVRNLPVSLADSWHDFDRRSAFSLRLVCLAHSYMKHSQAHESSSFVQSRVFR